MQTSANENENASLIKSEHGAQTIEDSGLEPRRHRQRLAVNGVKVLIGDLAPDAQGGRNVRTTLPPAFSTPAMCVQ